MFRCEHVFDIAYRANYAKVINWRRYTEVVFIGRVWVNFRMSVDYTI